jgi:hypothetical protein
MKSGRKPKRSKSESAVDIGLVVEATLRVLQRDGLLMRTGHRAATPTHAHRPTSDTAATPDEEDLG